MLQLGNLNNDKFDKWLCEKLKTTEKDTLFLLTDSRIQEINKEISSGVNVGKYNEIVFVIFTLYPYVMQKKLF